MELYDVNLHDDETQHDVVNSSNILGMGRNNEITCNQTLYIPLPQSFRRVLHGQLSDVLIGQIPLPEQGDEPVYYVRIAGAIVLSQHGLPIPVLTEKKVPEQASFLQGCCEIGPGLIQDVVRLADGVELNPGPSFH